MTRAQSSGSWLAATALAATALLAGCGSVSESDPGTGPVTPKSLAAVVADHAGKPRSSSSYQSRDLGDDGVGTQVRYPGGASVYLAVGARSTSGAPDCAHPPAYAPGCATVDGAVLTWATEEPEEDPGIIHLYLEKGGSTVLLTYAGPKIDGDPRQLDLPIDVDTLVDIVEDPRVH